ncbi:MAG: hypothetical protein V8R75_14535 [Oscillospiraceae bacterium]
MFPKQARKTPEDKLKALVGPGSATPEDKLKARVNLDSGPDAVCEKGWIFPRTFWSMIASRCAERFDSEKGGLYETVKPDKDHRSVLPSQPG